MACYGKLANKRVSCPRGTAQHLMPVEILLAAVQLQLSEKLHLSTIGQYLLSSTYVLDVKTSLASHVPRIGTGRVIRVTHGHHSWSLAMSPFWCFSWEWLHWTFNKIFGVRKLESLGCQYSIDCMIMHSAILIEHQLVRIAMHAWGSEFAYSDCFVLSNVSEVIRSIVLHSSYGIWTTFGLWMKVDV